jgi:hypothetical protein
VAIAQADEIRVTGAGREYVPRRYADAGPYCVIEQLLGIDVLRQFQPQN